LLEHWTGPETAGGVAGKLLACYTREATYSTTEGAIEDLEHVIECHKGE